ncbi:sensor of ECF-type sigma factor [Polaribacter sp. Z022]|uniref:sensor of ECF-type sigma factor n=1 Tax=Polaribacter sp. Z022 TaxID=2927125 RepID=UPI002020EE40|nr:sensor of ECF-type sigma factor [Polaribacter sp. Z022]MCL7754212.1 sensor of ECF-type sigma factor [Polaribacter sp. Z022]
MKKIITLITITLFCICTVNAQGKKSREKIKALKIAYLTEQLNLTSTEAEKFWPIYNAYSEKQHKLRNIIRTEIKNTVKENGDINSVSEKTAERIIKLKLATDKKIYEAQNKFIDDIKKIISYQKIMQLQVAELNFGRKLMKKYRHKKGNSKN